MSGHHNLLTHLAEVTTLMFEEVLLEFLDIRMICVVLPLLSVRIRSVLHPASKKHINWHRLLEKRCDVISFNAWQQKMKLGEPTTLGQVVHQIGEYRK